MSTEPPSGSAMYDSSHATFVELIGSLTPDQWSTDVPCLPGWNVRDTLGHVCGVAGDFLAGNMDGAPSEAWTAAQVERNRDMSIDELLERWSGQVADVGAGLDAAGGSGAAFDCQAHEHDIRQALDLPGNRDNIVVQAAAGGMAQAFDLGFPLTLAFSDGPTVTSGTGDGNGVALNGISTFEFFRSMLGRRSAAQLAGYEWDGAQDNIATVMDNWFFFGPAGQDVDE